MPIRNLTGGQAFTRIGKLHKGGAKSAKGFGRDLTYWRFVPEVEDSKDCLDAWNDAYGENPTSITVHIAHETMDKVFSFWREEWGKGGLKHRCDGEYCVKWREGDHYVNDPDQILKHRCPYKDLPEEKKLCKQVGRLVVMPVAMLGDGYTGTIMLETHSWNDIKHLKAILQELAKMNGGSLRGIPCILSRQKQTITRKTQQGPKRVQKYLARLSPTPEWLAAHLASIPSSTSISIPSGAADEIVAEIADDEPEEPPDGDEWGEFLLDDEDAEVVDETPAAQPTWGTFSKQQQRMFHARANKLNLEKETLRREFGVGESLTEWTRSFNDLLVVLVSLEVSLIETSLGLEGLHKAMRIKQAVEILKSTQDPDAVAHLVLTSAKVAGIEYQSQGQLV